eukprot:1873870-Pyramimonas_sp.AAC.1
MVRASMDSAPGSVGASPCGASAMSDSPAAESASEAELEAARHPAAQVYSHCGVRKVSAGEGELNPLESGEMA